MLWEAIDALPEKLRSVIVLASIEGHDIAAVARLLGIPARNGQVATVPRAATIKERLQWLNQDRDEAMSDDEFDREITALLDVEPSPDFVARVRMACRHADAIAIGWLTGRWIAVARHRVVPSWHRSVDGDAIDATGDASRGHRVAAFAVRPVGSITRGTRGDSSGHVVSAADGSVRCKDSGGCRVAAGICRDFVISSRRCGRDVWIRRPCRTMRRRYRHADRH